MNKVVFRVKDIWHEYKYEKGEEPWVYSDNHAFENNDDFFKWISQHTNGKINNVELIYK